MTTPTKAAKSAAPKANVTEEPKVAVETVPDDVVETTQEKPRIPEILANSPIFAEFCERYLGVYDEISNYNKEVLASRDSEWNAGKVLEKAREFARPTDKNVQPKDDIKKALEAYEALINETARARKAILDITSNELGITLSATSDRNPETEAPLKEKRKVAIEIGSNLSTIGKMTNDEKTTEAINTFLAANPMPAIGRDQARVFGDDGKSTPKYRVIVEVSKDGTSLLNVKGFTAASLALTKPAFGYERGKAIKTDDLRKAWESAGNTPEKTVTNPVEFEDNGLHFKISKN